MTRQQARQKSQKRSLLPPFEAYLIFDEMIGEWTYAVGWAEYFPLEGERIYEIYSHGELAERWRY